MSPSGVAMGVAARQVMSVGLRERVRPVPDVSPRVPDELVTQALVLAMPPGQPPEPDTGQHPAPASSLGWQ